MPPPADRRRAAAVAGVAASAGPGDPSDAGSALATATVAPPSPTPRFAEKRERILDGAARLFNHRGIKAGTLAEVAEQVGLATNSLTYYYRRKEDLVAACLLRAIAEVQALVDAADQAPGHGQRVASLLTGYVARMGRSAQGQAPELIYLAEMRALPQPQAQPVFDAYTALFRSVRRLLRDGPALPAPDARLALNARAHLLLSLAGWSRAWLGRFEPADHGQAAESLADLALHGLVPYGLASPGPSAPCGLGPGPGPDPGPGPGPGPGREAAWAEACAAPLPAPPPTDPLRDAYLRTAIRLVNAQGVGGASVERIAAELALTKGSFYHHHQTKDELIGACFERTFAVIRQAQAQADAGGGSGWQRLLRAVLPLARFQLSPQGPLLRVTSWAALPDEMRSDHFAAMNRLGERFGSFIVRGMADGSVRLLDPRIAAQQVNGLVNGLAEVEHWVPGVTADNVVALYARPLLFGLAH